MMESLVTEFDQLGHVRERSGPILPRIAPSNVYPTRDGIVMIGANQDTVFARLCEAMQAPQLAADPRYRDHQARGAHQQELDELIAALDRHARHPRAAGAARETRRAVRTHLSRRRTCSTIRISRRARPSSRPRHPQFGELRMQNVAPRLSATPELDPHAGAGARAAQRRGLSRNCSASTPSSWRRLRAQRRRSDAPDKKAGRCAPAFGVNCNRYRSGVEQPELGDAHHGRIALHGAERLGGLGLVVVAQVRDAEQQVGLVVAFALPSDRPWPRLPLVMPR